MQIVENTQFTPVIQPQYHTKQTWWTLTQEKNGLLAQQSKVVLGIKVFNKLMQYKCGNYVEKLTRRYLNMPISALSHPVHNLSLNTQTKIQYTINNFPSM